jgi:hypothetical protein
MDYLYAFARITSRQPFLIPALIFLAVSVPLAFCWVPRNRWYGVRTRRTLSDDVVWYASNRFCGLCLIASSLLYLSVAALLPYRSPAEDFDIWLVHAATFGLPNAASFVATYFYSKRL